MRNASLWCLAVIALSLLSTRAEAQIDSNWKLKLYFGSISNGCSFVVYCYDGVNQGSTFTLNTGFDSSIRVGDTNRYFESRSSSFLIDFYIDSVERKIRNLTIQNANEYYYIDPEQACEGGVTYSFDSIPFNYSNGSLKIIPSQYSGRSNTWAFCQYGVSNPCSGSCSDSGTFMDSLYFEILPSNDAVQNSDKVTNSFRLISNWNSELFSFSSSVFWQNLMIYDYLGRTVAVLKIPANVETSELPFANIPPGLYFARLGDQVAKFVVPPR